MEASTIDNINDRIWITSRVRMIAESKALRNQRFSYVSVTYYSLFTVILSVFSTYYTKSYPLLEQINLSSSVVVLVASLVAGGFRFEASASFYRECYLKLQRLHAEDLPLLDKSRQYDEILWDYPNHSKNDYYDFLVSQIWFEGNKLKNGDRELNYTYYMWFSYLYRRILYYGMLTALFLVPLLFLFAPLLCSWAK
ncbi:SLATT domain-containing protein [Rhizobium sp. CCGE531]|nr:MULTISPECIES: SLATT domain-containing protein [unclassified Rhizobium]AYG68297.1 SLATT domain-containing protein [Rhizobium sp. CCGE531]AYG74682.1 SLATT domain-containing protein [Rhizobium sp. CCGE532]